jgi:hypothetical protein
MEEVAECQIEVKEKTVYPKIWVITFSIRGKDAKGCAVVKAPNSNEAIKILTSSGMYNGFPKDYLVSLVEEVVVPPCCGLMAEQIVYRDGR